MLPALRIALIIACTVAGFFAGEVFPHVFTQKHLFTLAGFFIAVGAAFFWLMPKISDLANLSGLTETEHDRLAMSSQDYRNRVWRVAYVCAACIFVLILSVAAYGIDDTKTYSGESMTKLGAIVGFLIGVGASYLVVVRVWYEEIHQFTDEVKMRDANRKRLAEALKDMGSQKHSNINGAA